MSNLERDACTSTISTIGIYVRSILLAGIMHITLWFLQWLALCISINVIVIAYLMPHACMHRFTSQLVYTCKPYSRFAIVKL